ncbi:MAG: DUF2057 domain-containing protein [Psychromonas sp.]
MKGLVLILSLMVLPFSHAATLSAGNSVEILAVDGKDHDSGFLEKGTVNLSEGKHQIVIKYEKNFKKGGLVTSKPYIFDLKITGDTVISVKKFNNERQAQNNVNRGLTWIITDQKNTYNVSDADQLQASGFLPYSDLEKLITEYNQQNGVVLTATTATVAGTAAVVNSTSNNVSGSVTQQQLIDTYNSASKEQQKAFRIWLIEQDMK